MGQFVGGDAHCDTAQLMWYWHSCGDPPKTYVESIDRINLKSMWPWPLVKQKPGLNPSLQSCSGASQLGVFLKSLRSETHQSIASLWAVRKRRSPSAQPVCSAAESVMQTAEHLGLVSSRNKTMHFKQENKK